MNAKYFVLDDGVMLVPRLKQANGKADAEVLLCLLHEVNSARSFTRQPGAFTMSSAQPTSVDFRQRPGSTEWRLNDPTVRRYALAVSSTQPFSFGCVAVTR
ncbi:hypothetical protein CIHG_06136 [Coccidioides immitis H538.4]|uniref:Uncharacterized protein n=3 Tax=Coccidioides immitis TaxID=5501 RepID=A0A0J8QWW4_COCIT|nr:hypothetical protein CIRG_00076 [Coccidioides immitis RMSCC 2394]KMU75843.1 hypothetical protein CISG_05240 [Coccidioides immitis RMSCC 3703]KMU88338.1 hypothetical protein CIHG_06136 [Coccidioides immitis H538.4]